VSRKSPVPKADGALGEFAISFLVRIPASLANLACLPTAFAMSRAASYMMSGTSATGLRGRDLKGGRGSAPTKARATPDTVCQKCLGKGHFLFECTQERTCPSFVPASEIQGLNEHL
jgi:hypothetical protein